MVRIRIHVLWVVLFFFGMSFCLNTSASAQNAAQEEQNESIMETDDVQKLFLSSFLLDPLPDRKGGLVHISCSLEDSFTVDSVLIQLKDPEFDLFWEETILTQEEEIRIEETPMDPNLVNPQNRIWSGALYLPAEYANQKVQVLIAALSESAERVSQIEFLYDFHAHCDEKSSFMNHLFYKEKCIFCSQEQWVTGLCGKIHWSLNRESGELRFVGEGMMRNYSHRNQTPWKEYSSEIQTIILDEGITRIGAHAFYGLSALKKVVLPESLRVIGDYAFKKCKELKIIYFPFGLITIGDSAFYECSSLTKLAIPSTLEKLGDYSFAHCTKLEEMIFEGKVPKIGTLAFNEDCIEMFDLFEDSGWEEIQNETFGGKIIWMKDQLE